MHSKTILILLKLSLTVQVAFPASSLAKHLDGIVEGKLCDREQFVTTDPFDGDEFKEMVKIAIQLWNDAVGRRILRYEPAVLSTEKRFWITVEIASVGDLKDLQLGITFIHRNERRSPSCISGAPVKIEPNTDSYDIKLMTIIHELGHALGLDHSKVKRTIMYLRITELTKFVLGTDTVKELRELYPRN